MNDLVDRALMQNNETLSELYSNLWRKYRDEMDILDRLASMDLITPEQYIKKHTSLCDYYNAKYRKIAHALIPTVDFF